MTASLPGPRRHACCRDSSGGADLELLSKTSADMSASEPEKAAAKRRGRFHVVEDASEAGNGRATLSSAGSSARPTVSRNPSAGLQALLRLLTWQRNLVSTMLLA